MSSLLGQNNIYSQFLGTKAVIRTYKGDELINEYVPQYIPPADWKDIRVDCPANSIALYAAHTAVDYTTEGYRQIGTAPYNVVGNLSISNGVMSGFSTTEGSEAYATIEEYPTETVKSFRIKVKFTTGSTVPQTGESFYLFGQKDSNYDTPQLYIDGTRGTLHYSHPLGSSWGNYAESTGSILANTTYWAIVEWVYNKTTVYLSTDGISYSAGVSSSNSNISWTGKTAIGVDYSPSLQKVAYAFIGGVIDLNETSIEVNSKVWFKYGGKITAVNNNNLYLQSSGTQYINTGIIPSNNIGFDSDYETANDIATTNYGAIFGTRVSGSSSNFQLTSYTSDASLLGAFRFGDSANSVSAGMVKNTRQQVSFRNLVFTNASGTTYTLNTYSWANGNPILLYAFNDNGSAGGKATAKIYRQKFYDGDTLIRDFVPVKQGMVIGNFTVPANGMWDLVNQEYYSNFGTGDFTYGGGGDTQYDNLGFTATCVGGYNVFIDGTQYGSTYASGSTCTITWSTSGIATGDDITTPTALKAHKIWIEPATAGNDITAFHCARVAASGTEQQGVLWSHFNIDNVINAALCLGRSNYYANAILEAITAKNNLLKVSDLQGFAYGATSLEYVPTVEGNNPSTVRASSAFGGTGIKKISLRNIKFASSSTYTFYNSKIEKINFKNVDTSGVSTFTSFFGQTFYIKSIPEMDYSEAEDMSSFIYFGESLENTVLDVRAAKKLNRIGCYGSNTHFMDGFKGLRVSSEAPFDNATPPQITVQYTGMDRTALVQLFNDLPYNVGYEIVGSPTIESGVVSGFSSGDYIQTNGSSFSTDLTKLEIGMKVNLGELGQTDGQNKFLFRTTTLGNLLQGYISENRKRIYFQFPMETGFAYLYPQFEYQPNTIYWLKFIFENKYIKIKYSLNGIDFNEFVGTQEITTRNAEVSSIKFCENYHSDDTNFALYLDDTYVKINDVYWFRGQPARVDKPELNCKGCTGALDLTEADRDIAEIEKNWRLTYQ